MSRPETDVLAEMKATAGPIDGVTDELVSTVALNLLTEESVEDCLLLRTHHRTDYETLGGQREIGSRHLFVRTPLKVMSLQEITWSGRGWRWSPKPTTVSLRALYWQDIQGVIVSQSGLGVIPNSGPSGGLGASFIDDVANTRVAEFGQTLQRLVAEAKVKMVRANNPAEFIAELERLAVLRRSGMLTDEEFAQAKQKLLSS